MLAFMCVISTRLHTAEAGIKAVAHTVYSIRLRITQNMDCRFFYFTENGNNFNSLTPAEKKIRKKLFDDTNIKTYL